MENSQYENKNTETKHLNNMVKNSLLEVEKDSIDLKDRELKDREGKIEREIEDPFFKPFIVAIDNMYKFKQKEIKKKRPITNTWYD